MYAKVLKAIHPSQLGLRANLFIHPPLFGPQKPASRRVQTVETAGQTLGISNQRKLVLDEVATIPPSKSLPPDSDGRFRQRC